jgi:hypothetical protein
MRYTIEHAIIRGVIEKNDAGAFLGSTIGLSWHIDKMKKFDLLVSEHQVTQKGQDLYDTDIKNKGIPECRWTFWPSKDE